MRASEFVRCCCIFSCSSLCVGDALELNCGICKLIAVGVVGDFLAAKCGGLDEALRLNLGHLEC